MIMELIIRNNGLNAEENIFFNEEQAFVDVLTLERKSGKELKNIIKRIVNELTRFELEINKKKKISGDGKYKKGK